MGNKTKKVYSYLAKSLIITILHNDGEITKDGMWDLYEIRKGNKEVLLEHIKAISKIMNCAIKELEDEKCKTQGINQI